MPVARPDARPEPASLDAVPPLTLDPSKLDSDPSTIVHKPGLIDRMIDELDSEFTEPDFTFLESGPLSLEGVTLPFDKVDFAWKRVRKATGEDDVANVRALENTGWRPVPAELLPAAKHFTRQNSMHGGVAVEGMQLFWRSKNATQKVRAALNNVAEQQLDNVLAQYDSRVSRNGLMSSQAPKSSFEMRRAAKEYRGREAVAQMDDED